MAGILTYLWVVSDTPEERLTGLVAGLGVEAEEVAVTTAQKLRAEGRLEGRVEGRIGMLIEQLTLKFGTLSDERLETIRAGEPDQVTTWSARLIGDAATIDDVLD